MDSLNTITKLVVKKCYMASIDLMLIGNIFGLNGEAGHMSSLAYPMACLAVPGNSQKFLSHF
jgi:hypothetical protein